MNGWFMPEKVVAVFFRVTYSLEISTVKVTSTLGHANFSTAVLVENHGESSAFPFPACT